MGTSAMHAGGIEAEALGLTTWLQAGKVEAKADAAGAPAPDDTSTNAAVQRSYCAKKKAAGWAGRALRRAQ
jgi:hypothetical protein